MYVSLKKWFLVRVNKKKNRILKVFFKITDKHPHEPVNNCQSL